MIVMSIGEHTGHRRAVGVGTHGEIGQIDGCPGDVLGYAGNGINDDFTRGYEQKMDHPCTYKREQNKTEMSYIQNFSSSCGENKPLRLTHSALMLAYAAWSSASSFVLATCSTLRKLPLRPRL
jgi:hypothetical protein